jgi:hypothetical protein
MSCFRSHLMTFLTPAEYDEISNDLHAHLDGSRLSLVVKDSLATVARSSSSYLIVDCVNTLGDGRISCNCLSTYSVFIVAKKSLKAFSIRLSYVAEDRNFSPGIFPLQTNAVQCGPG